MHHSEHHPPSGRRLRGAARAGLAAALGLGLAVSTALPALSTEEGSATLPPLGDLSSGLDAAQITPDLADAEGQVTAFVQLRGLGAFEATQPEGVRSGNQAPVQAAAEAA